MANEAANGKLKIQNYSFNVVLNDMPEIDDGSWGSR
jgi:hypothetical protein